MIEKINFIDRIDKRDRSMDGSMDRWMDLPKQSPALFLINHPNLAMSLMFEPSKRGAKIKEGST